MKRSEMVEYIKAELTEMLDSASRCSEAVRHQPERFARSILDMVEGFGMLPPPAAATGTKDELEGHIQNCQWEPEHD